MIPSPQFQQALSQLRLQVRRARASIGHGDRRSRSRGSGMEFADYREYAPGDDTRHLDARLHARLGTFHVREYEVMRQLPVTILVDASRSMTAMPAKLEVARLLANCLGYAALAGNDRVRVAVWTGRRLERSGDLSGQTRARRLFEWVEGQQPSGDAPVEHAIPELAELVSANGLAILISDFWLDDPRQLVRGAASRGAEVWALQVLSRSEIAPQASASGVQLSDAETGDAVELTLDTATIAQYAAAFERWQSGLAQAVRSVAGQHFLVPTDMDLDRLVSQLRGWGLLA